MENYIHPLVKIERDNFINQELSKKSKFVVIEVPLLFEKNLEHEFDKIILVDVTENIQEKRALLRKNMSKEVLKMKHALSRRPERSSRVVLLLRMIKMLEHRS